LNIYQIFIGGFDFGQSMTGQECFGQNYFQRFIEDWRGVVLIQTCHFHLEKRLGMFNLKITENIQKNLTAGVNPSKLFSL
jgi:hypothetical protein